MWLPKDERRLLVGYYRSMEGVGIERLYDIDDFVKFLKKSTSTKDAKTQGVPFVDVLVRSQKANKILHARGLINLTTCPPQQPGSSVHVSLTVDGYDLGQRYSGNLSRIILWLKEVGKLWFIPLIVGVVGTKLVEWIWSFLNNRLF